MVRYQPLSNFPDRQPPESGRIGRAPAQFDFAKLDSINSHYIRAAEDGRLVELIAERLETLLGHPLSGADRDRLLRAMPELKLRPKTLVELAANARFFVAPRPIALAADAAKLLTTNTRQMLGELRDDLVHTEWRPEALEERLRAFADRKSLKLGAVAQPLRAALTGSLASPGIFEVLEVLGREDSLGRIDDAAGGRN
jgi:glutamyl-tRNA synthetase